MKIKRNGRRIDKDGNPLPKPVRPKQKWVGGKIKDGGHWEPA